MPKWLLALLITFAAGIGLSVGLLFKGETAAPGINREISPPTETEGARAEARAGSQRAPDEAPQHDEGDEARAGSRSAREAELSQQVAQLKQARAEAQAELKLSRQRLAAVETPEQNQPDPRQFDLGPEDWRRLGEEGTLKLRIPCAASPSGKLTPTQLHHLGLAPEDGPIVAAAFQHSAERVWATLEPLCAEALGISLEQAAARGAGPCRHSILNQASQKGTALSSFQRAAAYLAGDAEEPAEQGPVERLVFALSQEQKLLKAELAEHFGPDEADRLVFSRGLCFTEATHYLGGQKGPTMPATEAP